MKPLLLLDVDGVLLHQRKIQPRMRRFLIGQTPMGFYNQKLTAYMSGLADLYEIVWCTGWGEHAKDVIAPLFDMRITNTVPLKFPADWTPRPQYEMGTDDWEQNLKRNWKLPSVKEWLEDEGHADRPLAWVDDEIGQTDIKRWAQKRHHTKLVHVRGDRGFTSAEWDMLFSFRLDLDA